MLVGLLSVTAVQKQGGLLRNMFVSLPSVMGMKSSHVCTAVAGDVTSHFEGLTFLGLTFLNDKMLSIWQ